MQITKLFNRAACLTLAIAALGIVGCAHHPERTASQYWGDKMTSRHVKSALDKAPTYKYPGVSVSTYDGIVSLGGFVNTEPQKREAIDIARNVTGVREVVDNLVVKTEPTGRAPVVRNPDKINPQTLPSREQPNFNTNTNAQENTK